MKLPASIHILNVPRRHNQGVGLPMMSSASVASQAQLKQIPNKPAPMGSLQRACACGQHSHAGGECSECKKKRLGLQRWAVNESGPTAAPPIVFDVLRSPGQQLDAGTRAFTEQYFGCDFSSVRVHTDTRASKAVRAVNARAFTVGNHIVFGNDLYNPSSHEGKKLIAHELTHVIQQDSVASSVAQEQSLRISEPGDRLEHEADIIAGRVTGGERIDNRDFTRTNYPENGVQRFLLQRDDGNNKEQTSEEKKPDKPWIPIPVFDQFDPAVIVPDIPQLPGFVRGQKVPLSYLKKALDILRGKKKGASDSKQICDLIPGMEIAELGNLAGQCCEKFKRDEEHCCDWRNLSIKDGRCCRKDEVLLPDNSCFKPKQVPINPTSPISSVSKPPGPTPSSRFDLKIPSTRFGTIESTTIDKFELNSAMIPTGYEKELDHLAALLKIYKDAEIHIEGYTDSSYTEEYNQALSNKRANVVKQALVKRGVSAAKMTVVGFGETQLRFPAESNEEEKAANRRVEVWFYTPPSKTTAEELQLRVP